MEEAQEGYAAALEELREKRKVEKEEWRRKLAVEKLEFSEWERRFHAGYEEADRKYHAEKEELDKKREANHKEYIERLARESDKIKYGPPVSFPIVPCSIPSPPVQEVSTLQVFPSFPIIETSVK